MRAIDALPPASLLLAGVTHLLPVLGVAGGGALHTLYGITIDEPNVELLMRHRAMLLGALGAFLIAAAFSRPLRPAGFLLGIVSVASFLALAAAADSVNAEVRRVAAVDVVVLGCLLAGGLSRGACRRPDVT